MIHPTADPHLGGIPHVGPRPQIQERRGAAGQAGHAAGPAFPRSEHLDGPGPRRGGLGRQVAHLTVHTGAAVRNTTEPTSGGLRIVTRSARWYRTNVPHRLPFHVVGVSHHTAAVGVRERFALTPDELAAVLAQASGAGR